ncbi:MAG: CPBP family intramembrane metalloprotease [Pseudomonadales bacterium]|nr:CPBP family intramembrane metalloprotease [Pseudomonadales bacterium]
MNHTSLSAEPRGITASLNPVVDIAAVATVSLIVLLLEDWARAQGLLGIGEDMRAVTAVIAGASTAVGINYARGGRLSDLGFKKPSRWSHVPLQVFGIIAAFFAVQGLAALVVAPYFDLPTPDLSKYEGIAGNLGAAAVMFLLLPLTASIPEEIIYRGFLIGRLEAIFDQSFSGVCATLGIQALIFGAIHFQWGVGGMIVTTMMGLVWGTAYILCDRNLWVVILAHSVGHLFLVTQLYLADTIVIW